MRIEWSPIKLDPDKPLKEQRESISESIKEEQIKQDAYYGDIAESMDRIEQQIRETLLPHLTTYSNKYIINNPPTETYYFSKYLAGTFMIHND